MRIFLVAGCREVSAVHTVEQRTLGQVAGHAERRFLAQCVAVECDANPLSTDGSVAKVHDRIFAARTDFMPRLKTAPPTAAPTATPLPVARMRCTNVRRVLVARKKSDVLKIVSIRSALGACASDIIFSPVLLDLNFIGNLLLDC